jgi:hypothetical protein
MKKLVKNIIIFILPFLIVIVVFFIIPVNKKFSYNFVKGECENKAGWIYHRIFNDEKQIDIAFTGASQTSCAIMDEYIEKELSNRSGKNIEVANLGYCRRGRDIQYVMLKELFKHKKPSILVIEVAEDEPKKSHPVFPYLAESTDLWGSFVFFNQRFLTNIRKGIVIRFEQLKSGIFKNDYPVIVDKTEFGYLTSNQLATSADLTQNKLDWQLRNSILKPALIRNIELKYSKHYLEKIVQLAQRSECKILFLYLPEYGSGMTTPLLKEYYKEFGELIVLPDSIISNRLNWQDATHFNDSGAKKASGIIMQEMAAKLKN